MLVTQNDLRACGLQWNTKTFSAHFGRMAVEWRLGKQGLQNVYDTNMLRDYAKVYLVRIKKIPHLARHKPHEKFEELLRCLDLVETNIKI
jgi:hypothetical protein